MPRTQDGSPFSGSTPQSRHASYFGALAGQKTAESKRARYYSFLDGRDDATDEEAEVQLGIRRSSICSTRESLKRRGLITPTGGFRVGCCGVKLTCWRVTTDDERIEWRRRQAEMESDNACPVCPTV